MAPKVSRCGVTNCVSSRRKPPAASRPARWIKRDLRSIGLAVEHALAEKGGAERDTIEAADERAVAPCLDRMNPAQIEKLAIEPLDALIDPGFLAPGADAGTGVDHRLEIADRCGPRNGPSG